MALKKEQFHAHDFQKVLREYHAAKTCIARMEEKLTAGDFQEVKLTAVDFLNSVSEVEKLMKRKEHYDRLAQTVEDLAKRGIDITLIKRSIS
ncbi:hypothetical protein [Sutcliffiella sp. FSL R7-0096]|uniref:hypothetical protein n=1 Tax=Sutcliffiella sp. FSL R7-0096 TaxID=2921670 RepID=UPI00315A1AE6